MATTSKQKKTAEQKLAALVERQTSIKTQIAKQKKLAAAREQMAVDAKLIAAGRAVQAAGLLDVPKDDLVVLLTRAASLKS